MDDQSRLPRGAEQPKPERYVTVPELSRWLGWSRPLTWYWLGKLEEASGRKWVHRSWPGPVGLVRGEDASELVVQLQALREAAVKSGRLPKPKEQNE